MGHHQLTIHYEDDELDNRLRREAEEHSTSKETVALRLIRRATELEDQEDAGVVGDRLRKFQGSLTEEDRLSLEEAIRDQDAVDLALWTR